MDKLNDEIHKCETCEDFPCTTKLFPFIFSGEDSFIKSDICKTCIGHCCKGVVLILMPCEVDRLSKLKCRTRDEYDRLKSDWCPYYDKVKHCCGVEAIKPVICRVATCRLIKK